MSELSKKQIAHHESGEMDLFFIIRSRGVAILDLDHRA